MAVDLLHWAATYAVHSTALLLAAWALATWWPRLSPRAEEGLWRAALLGAVLTASVPGLGLAPSASFEEPVPVARAPAAFEPAVKTSIVIDDLTPGRDAAPAVAAAVPLPAPPSAAASVPQDPAARSAWIPWALLAWGVAAGALLVRRVRAGRRFAQSLEGSRPVPPGPWPDALGEILRGAGVGRTVRFTVSEGIASPFVRGLFRAEIAIPSRALDEVPGPQARAMLAHEVAHVVRRDALAWALVSGLTTLLPFQPLHALALRRLRRAAEEACDRWAIERTGDGLALAECLARVAGWVLGKPSASPVPAMAHDVSHLSRRVGRILDPVPGEEPRAAVGLRRSLIATAVLATALFLPRLGRDARAEAPPETPRELAPTPMPVSEPEEDGLRLLDAEIEALVVEAAALEAEVAARDRGPAVRALVRRMLGRLHAVRTERERLRRLLDQPEQGDER